MINCEYSYARDCSECNEPICRRASDLAPNDYDYPDDDEDWDDDVDVYTINYRDAVRRAAWPESISRGRRPGRDAG